MNRSGKHYLGYVVLGIIWAVLIVVYYWGPNKASLESAPQSLPALATDSNSVVNQSLLAVSENIKDLVSPKPPQENKTTTEDIGHGSFLKQFSQEASLIGQTDPHPEKTRLRLQNWALVLGKDELHSLGNISRNPNRNGDERALAIYLLGLSLRPEALLELESTALLKSNTPMTAPQRELDRVLKLQAVENIVRPQDKTLSEQILHKILRESQDQLIVDRSIRGILSLTGKAPSPESQDQSALKKLITR